MIAIIPARGGSKGLPRKNIKPLCGKALIGYTIEAAKDAKTIDRIVVSTDDDEIAEIAKKFGAEVPFMRPIELAQDDSLAMNTYIYTVERLNDEFNANIDEFVVLLPTTPLRSAEDIDQAGVLFSQKSADSVISCSAMHQPIEWAIKVDEKGVIIQEDESNAIMMNRQKIEPTYAPNGAIYILKLSVLKERRSYYSDKTYAYVMPQERSVDIDNEFDFRFAEFLISEKVPHA